MILGRMDPTAVRQLVKILGRYADPQTLFVFSVDLSHFRGDREAGNVDMQTIQSIMSLDTESLARSVTDGNRVLLTMAELAKTHKWEPTYLKYLSAGDASGDRKRAPGYGSIVFHQPFSLKPNESLGLLATARAAIASSLDGKELKVPDRTFVESHPIFRIPRGVFVTLEKRGRLRGCIGELFPRGALYEAVQRCAINSATRDPRFPPVTPRELEALTISISILEFPRRVIAAAAGTYSKALRPGKDGVILIYRGRQSTFLPKVWEDIPEPADFLSRLCLKQGSPSDCWKSKEAALYRYGAYDFSEETVPE